MNSHRKLLQAIQDFVRLHDGLPVSRFSAALADAAKSFMEIETQACPLAAVLARMPSYASAETASLVAAILDHADSLRWQQRYTRSELPQAFLENNCWTDIAGPHGPVKCETARAGLFLLNAGQLYPAHAHAAEELYIPLAGHAAWQQGAEPFIVRPPGSFAHHASWESHALRTDAEPLLALYFWIGEGLDQRPSLGTGAATGDPTRAG